MISTWDWIRIALACIIEALYDIIGYLDEANWKSTLSMDKYFKSEYSYIRKQLRRLIDTRRLIVSIPKEKRATILKLLCLK